MHRSFHARLLAGGALGALVVSTASAQNHPSTSFFGGSAHDRVQGCAVDAQGRILVTGNTGSANFSQTLPPSKGGYQKTFRGASDAFVGVLSADLSTVIAWTYLGGSSDERGYGVTTDAQGRVWVVGFTESKDFPATNGSKWKGGKDVFVARFSPDLKSLQMCTLLGGAGEENARGAFALDAGGNVLVSGSTGSTDFPVTAGAFQPKHAPGAAGSWDGFVAKLDPGGHVVWSTYFGGSGEDGAFSGLALASDGSVVVAGMTSSHDLPVSAGAHQTSYGGDTGADKYTGDGFVARLSADGTKLVYSTYLGGSGDDSVSGNDALVLDDSDAAVVIGQATSHDLALPPGGWTRGHAPGSARDGFVVRLSPDGKHLLAGTFLGGEGDEELSGLELDSGGHVYLSGNTGSLDFPVTADATQPKYAGHTDALIAKLSADLSELLYSTYLGGSGSSGYGDRGRTLVLGAQNRVVLSGDTDSANFPTTAGTFDPQYDGGTSDGFVSTLSLGDTYTFGKGKTTSLGKVAALSFTGSASVSGAGFAVHAKNACPKSRGMMVWGPSGVAVPFQGGTLYPDLPRKRLPTKVTDAAGGVVYPIALSAALAGETRVYQLLFADPAQLDGTGIAMSNALKVVFTP